MKVIKEKTSAKSIKKAEIKEHKQKEQHEASVLHDKIEALQNKRREVDQDYTKAARALACELISEDEFNVMKDNMNDIIIDLLKKEAKLEEFNADELKELYL